MKLRSIGAVLAGLLIIVILSTAVDVVLHATGVFPPWGQPMSDRLFALGVVGVVISIIGAVATIGRGPEFGPTWYPLALVIVAMPCAWVGGRLRTA